jgi:hypothetical protein
LIAALDRPVVPAKAGTQLLPLPESHGDRRARPSPGRRARARQRATAARMGSPSLRTGLPTMNPLRIGLAFDDPEVEREFKAFYSNATFKYEDGNVLDMDPFYERLHSDPRWLPQLRKHGRAPEQLAALPRSNFNFTAPVLLVEQSSLH